MKLNLKNISIRDRIYFVIFLFLVSAICSAIILHSFLNKTNEFSSQLSAVHKLQDHVLLLNKNCNTIFKRNIYDVKEEIKNQEDIISNDILAIAMGGNVSLLNKKVKPLSKNAAKNIQTTITSWDSNLTNLALIQELPQKMDSTFFEEKLIPVNDSINQSVLIEKTILVNNVEMKEAVQTVSKSLHNLNQSIQKILDSIFIQLQNSYSNYNIAFIILGVINLIIFSFSFYWIRKSVVIPLKMVGQHAQTIANGNLSNQFEYKNSDEIGDISSSINRMTSYLQNASEFVHQIGDGNLDSQFKGIDESKVNEGSLAHALTSMREKLKVISTADEKRNWTTQGIAKFANIIRNNNDSLKQLSSVIMSSLVEYSDTNQGCMYILDEDENEVPYLNLSTYYAYDVEKFHKDKIMLGEGIVGQTFLEQKTTYLVEIPEGYMRLKSGLGRLDPHAVLVVPLIVNDEAFGVIELASFNEIDKYKIEFIEQLGEMIASSISNVRNNERTQQLLDESQKLAEQMKSQEEEMRQYILENLSNTQEGKSEEDSQSQVIITAIESSFATAELSIENIVENANAEFLNYSKFDSLDDIIGKNISNLITPYNSEGTISNLSRDLKSGNTIQGIYYINKTLSNVVMIPTKLMSDEHNKIMFFALPINQALIPSATDNHLTDLEEELQQNLDSLQVAEEAIRNKINHYNTIEDILGISIIEKMQIVFANQTFKNRFGNEFTVKTNKIMLADILDDKLITSIQEAIDNVVEISINTTLDDNEVNLKIIPIKGSKQTVMLSYN
ncbi:MAG: GAF domain-containing protein [Cyclobacteriaceae bacterium]|nr:GAF domain-containing protein [Cyclobacteriaceae bacterium]